MNRQVLEHARKSCAALVACAIFAAAFIVPVSSARAYDSDAALEADGFLCTRQIARAERKYGIPLRLLGAIANAESGRRHKGLGVQVPWPWTINAEGTPYLFHTKQEAVAKVRDLQSKGVKSIDVGCMQVNLMHHPNAFATINQAFEPSFNIDYAARYLRGHYDETGSWKTAVGYYHSRTPENGQKYIALVYNQWYNLAGSIARERGREYVRINGQETASTQKQRPATKYQSYVRNESSGQQIRLASRVDNPHLIRPGAVRKSALIEPEHAIATVKSAPGTDMGQETDSLVMNLTQEKVRGAKVVSVSDSKARDVSDERILKFVD